MSRTDPSASERDVTHDRLEIRTEWQPGEVVVVLRLSGEIDADSSRALDFWLRKRIPADSRYVVVDLSSVHLLSAPGVRVLVEHTDRQALAGRRIVTVGGNPHVQRVLRLLEATAVVGEYDSVPSAVAACVAQGRPVPSPSAGDHRPAVAGDGDVASLCQEVFRLRAALRTRPIVARALGVIQERYGLPDAEAAFGLLRDVAKKHHLNTHTFAEALLAAEAPQGDVWFPGRARRPAPSLSFSQQHRGHKSNRTAVLSLLLNAALEYMHTTMGDVQLVDAPGSHPRLELHRNLPPDLADHLADLEDPEAIAMQAVTGKARRLEDTAANGIWANAGIHTAHSTPLIADDECLGVVSTYHSERDFEPGKLQCAKLDHAATETATWLAWHRRTVIVDALEHFHQAASHHGS